MIFQDVKRGPEPLFFNLLKNHLLESPGMEENKAAQSDRYVEIDYRLLCKGGGTLVLQNFNFDPHVSFGLI